MMLVSFVFASTFVLAAAANTKRRNILFPAARSAGVVGAHTIGPIEEGE